MGLTAAQTEVRKLLKPHTSVVPYGTEICIWFVEVGASKCVVAFTVEKEYRLHPYYPYPYSRDHKFSERCKGKLKQRMRALGWDEEAYPIEKENAVFD